FTLGWWWRVRANGARNIVWILLSVAIGFACAAPVYADLALDAARSSRGTPDPAFFLPVLPEIQGPRDLALFFAQVFDAFWRGNPARSSYPGPFNGVCLGPLFAGLLLMSWLEGGWRRAGPWLAFVLVCVALTLWPAGYLFGVRHLGLSFSRFVPLAAAWIPMICAASIGLDRVLRIGFRRPVIALA